MLDCNDDLDIYERHYVLIKIEGSLNDAVVSMLFKLINNQLIIGANSMNVYHITCMHFDTQWKSVGTLPMIWVTFLNLQINESQYTIYHTILVCCFSSGGCKHSKTIKNYMIIWLSYRIYCSKDLSLYIQVYNKPMIIPCAVVTYYYLNNLIYCTFFK